MPPKKKETEDKIVIKRFKDKSSHFFVNNKHYMLDENNEIHFIAGGFYEEECAEALRAYCKRNKVTHAPRGSSILNQVEKEFISVIGFGKYNGERIQDLIYKDHKYLEWMRDKYNFSSAEQKLKEEITEILKK